MSLPIWHSSRFEQDVVGQTEWYLTRAGAAVAIEFGDKVDAVLRRLGEFPESGVEWRRPEPELAGLRFIPVDDPFDRFLIFYRVAGGEVRLARLMHGMRDLPHRLLEPPGAE
jgi:plasmid stabilization system protein ParE